jgi:hypothetical protein
MHRRAAAQPGNRPDDLAGDLIEPGTQLVHLLVFGDGPAGWIDDR